MRADFEAHARDARRENARWLIEDVGLSRDHVARRLGMSRAALDKMMGWVDGDTDSGVEPNEGQSA
jgi:DNA-binding transcriptional regulator LsrR (DeoR family)